MERDNARLFPSLSIYDFNSHAHVERDAKTPNHIISSSISTHTLTWSVTMIAVSGELNIDISTHTLTWSVTSDCVLFWHAVRISTHTLTWSVT